MTRVEGTGLGRYITRRVVEAHSGMISVGETPGGGTTFAVALPLGVQRPAEVGVRETI